MTRQNLIAAFFAALLLFVLCSTVYILSPFWGPIFWSALIAFGFYPLHLKILAWFRHRRDAAAFASTVLIFLTFVPIVAFVAISLTHEIFGAYEWLSVSMRNGGMERFLDWFHSLPIVSQIENSDFYQQEFGHESLKKLFLNITEMATHFALKQAAFITRNLFAAAINFLLMIFLVFFFLRDGDTIYRFLYRITPLEEKIKKEVYTQLGDTFSAVLRGQLVAAVVQAALSGIIFGFLGLPLPLFFAGITFLAALVPLFGASLIWGPFVIYLFVTKDYTDAVILLVLGTFVISFADNVLKPMLIGKKAKLPYLLLFLGILGGLHVYGLMGIFLAPAILSLFFVLIKIYQEEILTEQTPGS